MQWTIETQITPRNDEGGSSFEQLLEATRSYIDENYEWLTGNGDVLAALYRARDAALFMLNRSDTAPLYILITGDDAKEFGIQMSYDKVPVTAGGDRGQHQKKDNVDAGGGKR